MYTFGDLKNELRQVIFPTGEAKNLVTAHNKFFLDAVMDLQQWVECLQFDNTQLVPHCATFYKCGLTVFDAPRGIIRAVSVIDKLNDDGEEDPAAADDWCSEITYARVHPCHIQQWLSRAAMSANSGCCLSLPSFFALPGCSGATAPKPTDEGVDKLAPLPLGFHYAQVSTDSGRRAPSGIWAMERGKIYIAPWIQSTETVVIKWDGIKRVWQDADPIDDDPLLKTAVEEYVRWQHAAKFDKDMIEAGRAAQAFGDKRTELIRQCREETRERDCEASHARASAVTATNLFYNEPQQFTANCESNQTGESVTATVPSGTVASNVSVADANQKALDQAKSNAEAQLDCADNALTYTNDEQSYTASCIILTDPPVGTPYPEGPSVTVTIASGTVTSTISKADANTKALAQARIEAEAQVSCTFWNAEVEYTASCPSGTVGSNQTVTVAAHTHSSEISQSDADAKALNAAKTAAENALACTGGSGQFLFENTEQVSTKTKLCTKSNGDICIVVVTVTIPAGRFTSVISQNDANQLAKSYAASYAFGLVNTRCTLQLCGEFSITF